MIKILGLCLCYTTNNYGTMLQAYATTVAVERAGVPWEIIRYKKKLTPAFVLKSLPRLLNPVLMQEKRLVAQKKWHIKRRRDFSELSAEKDAAFADFSSRFFTRFSPVYYGYAELMAKAARYEAVLVGSDQIWSPSGLPTNFYNLMFAPEGARRISYASSFGVSSIPFFQKGRTKKFLERIEYLSVRENSARDIIRALTGREAKVVVDPTMLLTAAQWEEHIPRENMRKEPYLFAYFLGPNPQHRKAVSEAAKKLGLRLVTLRHMDEYVHADEGFGDEAPYDVGPERFVNLIRHAEYVCTDSFHGTVFSILHHRRFVVFNRFGGGSVASRNSRIESLCGNLGLDARRFDNAVPLEEALASPIGYDAVDARLESLRKESEAFLYEAIRGLEGGS